MIDSDELIREQIDTLQTYISLLEKIEGVFWGVRLNKAERAVMKALDRKIGQVVQFVAVTAGLGVMVLGLGVIRWFARSPSMFLGLFFICGMLGVTLAMRIYHQARCQIARDEIRTAQLEVYRLEKQLADNK
jgi:hypothetical protein